MAQAPSKRQVLSLYRRYLTLARAVARGSKEWYRLQTAIPSSIHKGFDQRAPSGIVSFHPDEIRLPNVYGPPTSSNTNLLKQNEDEIGLIRPDASPYGEPLTPMEQLKCRMLDPFPRVDTTKACEALFTSNSARRLFFAATSFQLIRSAFKADLHLSQSMAQDSQRLQTFRPILSSHLAQSITPPKSTTTTAPTTTTLSSPIIPSSSPSLPLHPPDPLSLRAANQFAIALRILHILEIAMGIRPSKYGLYTNDELLYLSIEGTLPMGKNDSSAAGSQEPDLGMSLFSHKNCDGGFEDERHERDVLSSRNSNTDLKLSKPTGCIINANTRSSMTLPDADSYPLEAHLVMSILSITASLRHTSRAPSTLVVNKLLLDYIKDTDRLLGTDFASVIQSHKAQTHGMHSKEHVRDNEGKGDTTKRSHHRGKRDDNVGQQKKGGDKKGPPSHSQSSSGSSIGSQASSGSASNSDLWLVFPRMWWERPQPDDCMHQQEQDNGNDDTQDIGKDHKAEDKELRKNKYNYDKSNNINNTGDDSNSIIKQSSSGMYMLSNEDRQLMTLPWHQLHVDKATQFDDYDDDFFSIMFGYNIKGELNALLKASVNHTLSTKTQSQAHAQKHLYSQVIPRSLAYLRSIIINRSNDLANQSGHLASPRGKGASVEVSRQSRTESLRSHSIGQSSVPPLPSPTIVSPYNDPMPRRIKEGDALMNRLFRNIAHGRKRDFPRLVPEAVEAARHAYVNQMVYPILSPRYITSKKCRILREALEQKYPTKFNINIKKRNTRPYKNDDS